MHRPCKKLYPWPCTLNYTQQNEDITLATKQQALQKRTHRVAGQVESLKIEGGSPDFLGRPQNFMKSCT